jgi:hypothetical protein
MSELVDEKVNEINGIRCMNNIDCKSFKYLITYNIKNMNKKLQSAKLVEFLVSDLNTYLNNNKEVLEIMKKETQGSGDYLNNQTNHFSVENYQLDELNKNKQIIDVRTDLYLNQIKKLFYIICILIIIYYMLISFKPK